MDSWSYVPTYVQVILSRADRALKGAGRLALILWEPYRGPLKDRFAAITTVLDKKNNKKKNTWHYAPGHLTSIPGSARDFLYDHGMPSSCQAGGGHSLLLSCLPRPWAPWSRSHPLECSCLVLAQWQLEVYSFWVRLWSISAGVMSKMCIWLFALCYD